MFAAVLNEIEPLLEQPAPDPGQSPYNLTRNRDSAGPQTCRLEGQ